MDAYEQGVRAILGNWSAWRWQRSWPHGVVALCGEPVKRCAGAICAFPHLRCWLRWIAGAEGLGMPVKRAESLIHLARSVVDGTFPLFPPADIGPG